MARKREGQKWELRSREEEMEREEKGRVGRGPMEGQAARERAGARGRVEKRRAEALIETSGEGKGEGEGGRRSGRRTGYLTTIESEHAGCTCRHDDLACKLKEQRNPGQLQTRTSMLHLRSFLIPFLEEQGACPDGPRFGKPPTRLAHDVLVELSVINFSLFMAYATMPSAHSVPRQEPDGSILQAPFQCAVT